MDQSPLKDRSLTPGDIAAGSIGAGLGLALDAAVAAFALPPAGASALGIGLGIATKRVAQRWMTRRGLLDDPAALSRAVDQLEGEVRTLRNEVVAWQERHGEPVNPDAPVLAQELRRQMVQLDASSQAMRTARIGFEADLEPAARVRTCLKACMEDLTSLRRALFDIQIAA